MNCWRLRQKRFVLLATALACSSEGSHAAKQSIARREISSAPVHVCTTPAGGIVVSLDSVAGLSTHATLGALRQQCVAGDSVLYDAVGWQAVAWAFPFAGARVTAVQSKHGFGDLVHDDEIPDLWTVEGDSVRLPDGHLVPQTLGLLRSQYSVTIVDENTGGDDIDGPHARSCRFPYLLFALSTTDTARQVPDSARVTRVDMDGPDTTMTRFCIAHTPPNER